MKAMGKEKMNRSSPSSYSRRTDLFSLTTTMGIPRSIVDEVQRDNFYGRSPLYLFSNG